MSNDVMKVADLVIELLTNTHWLAVLFVQKNAKFTHNSEHKVLTDPPPELWVEDSSVLRVGEDHEAVIGELLGDQGLVAFADVELVDVSLDKRLEGLRAQE